VLGMRRLCDVESIITVIKPCVRVKDVCHCNKLGACPGEEPHQIRNLTASASSLFLSQTVPEKVIPLSVENLLLWCDFYRNAWNTIVLCNSPEF